MRAVLIVCLLCGIASADARRVTGYVRGRPVTLRVVEIGWAEVEQATARAFLNMQEAAAADGIELVIWSGFRSHERQAALYARWRARRGALAARPGHSRHQSGHALDLMVRDPATLAWLDRHARRFGFRRTVRGEPWHWEHVRGRRVIAKPSARSTSPRAAARPPTARSRRR